MDGLRTYILLYNVFKGHIKALNAAEGLTWPPFFFYIEEQIHLLMAQTKYNRLYSSFLVPFIPLENWFSVINPLAPFYGPDF